LSGGYDLWYDTGHYISKNLGPLSVAVCIDIVGHTTVRSQFLTGGQMDIIHRVLHQLSSECFAAILNFLEFCLHVLTMRQVLHDVHDLPIGGVLSNWSYLDNPLL
jgi:hypothetical protein